MSGGWRFVAVGLFAVVLFPSVAAAASSKRYIVQLKADPLASYTGGRAGMPPTSPAVTRRKLNRSSAAARAYRAYLSRRQDAVLARLGAHAPKPL